MGQCLRGPLSVSSRRSNSIPSSIDCMQLRALYCSKRPVIRLHRLWRDPLDAFQKEIAPALNDSSTSWAITGAAASILVAPFLSQFAVVELYVDDDLFSRLANPLFGDSRRERRGSWTHLGSSGPSDKIECEGSGRQRDPSRASCPGLCRFTCRWRAVLRGSSLLKRSCRCRTPFVVDAHAIWRKGLLFDWYWRTVKHLNLSCLEDWYQTSYAAIR